VGITGVSPRDEPVNVSLLVQEVRQLFLAESVAGDRLCFADGAGRLGVAADRLGCPTVSTLTGGFPWRRTDPRETGFVDITCEQALSGQADGRTSTAVQAWPAACRPEFRAGVEVVAIDPHAATPPPSARRCPAHRSRSTTSI
jgi:hypothetical protein